MGRNFTEKIEIKDDQGNTHTDPAALSDMFISFFTDKVEALDLLCPVQREDIQFENVFHDIFFTEVEIEKALDNIKRSKAQGIDEIPGLVISDLGKSIVTHLAWLFNTILYRGIIPKSWKISKILPIFKKGNPRLISNYRPVSNIPSLSKVFERALVNKIEALFDRVVVNGPIQHGFLSGCSTVTAGLTVQDFVACEMDKGNIVLMYSADLSAAFDMLRPDILVNICRKKGFPDSICRIIHNFLSDRVGYVDIDGHPSILKKIPIGCVQGSVLGPRLFNIYTSELDNIIGPDFFKLAYADDSYVATSCQEDQYDAFKNRLEITLSKHFGWLKSLGMIINPSKTEYIVFTKPSLSTIKWDPLLVDGCHIYPTKNLKILGVWFSKNLDWNFHVDKAIKKANSMVYALRYLNSKVSRPQFASLIHAHFLSKLTYACQIWSSSLSSSLKKRLESCFFKVIRLLCRDFKGKIGRQELIEKSGIPSIRSVFIVRDMKLLHKFCTNLIPDPIVERLMSQCHILTRREKRLYFYDYSYKKIGRSSFINRSKYIVELIPFEWLHLNEHLFGVKIKNLVPNFLKLS